MPAAHFVTNCEIRPNCLSDHDFVIIELEGEPQIHGKGYWKFNNKLLHDKTFLDSMNQEIDKFHQRMYTDELERWEDLVVLFKGHSQYYANLKAIERKSKIKELEKRLSTQEKRLSVINLSAVNACTLIEKINGKIDEIKALLNSAVNACTLIEKINGKIDEIKALLNQEYNIRAQGAILCSKITWYKKGESNNSYFFGLEKCKAKNKTMSAVKIENGTIERNPKLILGRQVEYYRALYTSEPGISFNYKNPPVKISNTLELDSAITLDELSNALKEMKPNKSPGLSGITADFLKVFWGRIKHRSTYFAAIQKAIQREKMYDSARRGLITLIPKKDRDIFYVKNWRPITLLEVHYKILSKAIANRMKTSLNEIIHKDQTAFLKGRNISENVREVFDVMDAANSKNLAAVLILVDFEKAFDRVEYNALFSCLEYFGYGPYFIQLVKTLFKEFELSTTNAGYISDSFKPTIFQGNPAGPYIFLTIMEALAIQLRSNSRIKGLNINGIKHLLTQFTDDLSLFMDFSKDSWDATMLIFDKFQKNSGMRINYDKTTVYRLGSIHKTNARFYSKKKINWTSDPVNILGIWVSYNNDEVFKLNIDPLVKRAENVLNLWRVRGLSLLGKVLVVNTLVASLFIYWLTVLPLLPTKYLTKVKKLCKGFIWNQGKAKIDSKILTFPKLLGGAGLMHLQNKDIALKAQWVFKLKNNESLKERAYDALGNIFGDCLWYAQLDYCDLAKMFSLQSFWGDVLLAWNKISKMSCNSSEEIMAQPILLNSEIRIENKPCFIQALVNQSITFIRNYVMNKTS